MKILLFLFLVLVAGCQRSSKPPVASPLNTPSTIGNTADAAAALSSSNREIEIASAKRESAISAFMDVALEMIQAQQMTPAMGAIQAMIELARTTSIQPPDFIKLAAARQLAQLHAAGKEDEARQERAKLDGEARAAADAVVELRAAREKLEAVFHARIADLEKERADSLRKNQEAMNALTAEINELKSNYSKSLQAWTARILIGIGITGIVISGGLVWLSVSVNPLAAVKRAAPLVLGSLLSIGCGFIVNQPWFPWAVGITIIVFLGGMALSVTHARRTTTTLATTLRKTIQSAEEQQVENPAAALDFKEYQKDNLDDAEKKLVDDIKPSINRKYINEIQKKRAQAGALDTVTPSDPNK